MPVAAFQVEGGADRIINLRSTNDIGLVSELEQARSFQNIVLYLSGTKDHRDMKAAMDLTEIANNNFAVKLQLLVERYSGKKLLEGLALYDPGGQIKYPPQNAFDNTLMVHIALSETELFRGKVINHSMPKVKSF